MSAISFNSIFNGVSLALYTAFPPPVQVHSGPVKQGLKPGDFNVIMLRSGHSKEMGQRYKRTPLLDVAYYPQTDAEPAECYDMADRLTRLLGSITTPEGDVIHATTCEWSMDGDVLHVLVRYDHCVHIPLDEAVMETLQIKQEG